MKSESVVDALASMLRNAIACAPSRFGYEVPFAQIVGELDESPALAVTVLTRAGFAPVSELSGLWRTPSGAGGIQPLARAFDVSTLVDLLDILAPV